ncbi:hypothetical protein BB561_001824 [Smittium simulii]|uniref:SPX domain-containing protein n=1 Tax=Smittium simulii TaxID=133385 RepID=A0A2T9YSV7_9FUNG|nr:hypothetical protein BB561_001824 [Smittium simulii]
MKYGKHMQKHKIEGWEAYYLDYKKLKKFIRHLINTDQVQENLSAAKVQFFAKLDKELDIVGSFYSKIVLKLKTRNDHLQTKQAELDTLISTNDINSSHLINLLEEAWNHLQTELDKLQNFAEINSTGVSKIVKKWDKQTRSATKQLYLERQAVIRPWFDRLSISKLADTVAKGLIDLNRTKSLFFESHTSSISNIFNISNAPTSIMLSLSDFDSCKNSSDRAYLALKLLNNPDIDSCVIDLILNAISHKTIDLTTVDQVSGRSLVHAGARSGIFEIVKTAIEAGANLNYTDSYGCYPIYYAIVGGYSSIVKLLLNHNSELNINSQGIRSLQLAASLDNFETFYNLLSESTTQWCNQDMTAALFKCSQTGNWKIANALLDQGLDVVGVVNDLNQSALHISSMNGHLRMSNWLISVGASVELKDKDSNWTPLFFAANEGYTSIVKLLLDNNSDPLAFDDQGYTPAFYAAYHGHMECVKLLFRNSNPITDNKSESCIHDDDFIPSLELPPPIIPLQISKRSYNSNKKLAIIRFCSNTQKYDSLVKFIRHINLNSLRLEINTRSSENLISHTIQLPLQEKIKYLNFEVSKNTLFNFEFLLFPSFGSVVIGKAILSNQVFGLESGVNLKLPLIGSDMNVVAELVFDFLAVDPLTIPIDRPSGLINDIWDNININPTENSQNKYFAVGVQVTFDGIPVVYSKKTLKMAENLEFPIDRLNLSQINSLTKADTSIINLAKASADLVYSQSIDSAQYRDTILNSCIPLEQFLVELPQDIALVISMILPSNKTNEYKLNGFVDAILSKIFTSALKSQKLVLKVEKSLEYENKPTYEKVFSRSIFLSSNSPTICLLAQWKQPVYPVILDIHSDSVLEPIINTVLTGQGKNSTQTIDNIPRKIDNANTWDPPIKSLKSACKFSFTEELFGIICESSLLSQVPNLTSVFSEYKLFLIQNVPNPSTEFNTLAGHSDTDAYLRDNIMYLKAGLL